jgi:hypothetical protein
LHLRDSGHSFLIVAAATARPLAVFRGLPLQTKKLALASPGVTLVYDAGKLSAQDHTRLLEGLGILRGLAYENLDAPQVLLVGGEPMLVLDGEGKELREGIAGIGGHVLGTLRDIAGMAWDRVLSGV